MTQNRIDKKTESQPLKQKASENNIRETVSNRRNQGKPRAGKQNSYNITARGEESSASCQHDCGRPIEILSFRFATKVKCYTFLINRVLTGCEISRFEFPRFEPN